MMLQGRLCTCAWVASPPVVVVAMGLNKSALRRMWPGLSLLGTSFECYPHVGAVIGLSCPLVWHRVQFLLLMPRGAPAAC